MNKKNKIPFIDVKNMKIKSGGSYQGLKDQFQIDPHTGEGGFEIPLPVSKGRGYDPDLRLRYSTAAGNSEFGMGFSLALPVISRKTELCFPCYEDDTDIFILNTEGELVPGSSMKADGQGQVTQYRARRESCFSLIEHVQSHNHDYWKVTDRNNRSLVLGRKENSRLTDPDDPSRIFAWQIDESCDDKGNRIQYCYNDQHLITTIRYGNYRGGDSEDQWGITIEFNYRYDRSDDFTSYRSGFEIHHLALCNKISLNHHFEDTKCCIRETELYYSSGNGVSLLEQVTMTGIDKEGNRLKQPDLCLDYTPFTSAQRSWQELEIANNNALELNRGQFLLADLWGEGIPGILYLDGQAAWYSRALGEGRYAAWLRLDSFPIHKVFEQGHCSLVSLSGNGKYDLLIQGDDLNGYYELLEDGWGNFQPFEQYANEHQSNSKEWVDLQGDKHLHLLVTESDGLRYYPVSKGKGIEAPIRRQIPEDFYDVTSPGRQKAAVYLDMFGDGLLHRVMIQNGSVRCFPNQGYGSFGSAIEVANAPYDEEGLDVSRLLFADIDGTGTADFIYLRPDRADIYFNQSGRSFADPVSVMLPEQYTQADTVQFADILGNGTNCMIFGKTGSRTKYYYYDFSDAVKPYMLHRIDGNRGSYTKLEYTSSVGLYLDDCRKGRAWEIKTPFPVHLVTKMTDVDQIADTSHSVNYRYREARYDFAEKHFIGFGVIEELRQEANSEPVRIRKYYDIGSGKAVGDDDEQTRARYGKLLREEVYAGDNGTPAKSVTHLYGVREEIPPQNGAHGSHYVYLAETIECRNENTPDDPSVHHELVLAVDLYGNVTRRAEVYYPRKGAENQPIELAGLTQQQKAQHIICQEYEYSSQVGKQRYLGVPVQQKVYEITASPVTQYYTREILNKTLEAECTKVLQNWKQYYYWDEEQHQALPLGKIAAPCLLHHEEAAAFPEQSPFLHESMDASLLKNSCGYLNKGGFWWKPGLTRHYYPADQFYLPFRECSEFLDVNTRVEYDPYCLRITKLNNYLDISTVNSITGVPDYITLEYYQVIDENDNVSQNAYDPLGQVLTTKTWGSGDGDREAVTVDYQYDLTAFKRERTPAAVTAIYRDMTVFAQASDYPITITYWDGKGRKLEERQKADGDQWIVKDRVHYNNADRIISQYIEYMTDDQSYSGGSSEVPPTRRYYDYGQRMVREEQPRAVGLDQSWAFLHSRVKYGVWEQHRQDFNSCLADSQYYQEFIRKYPDEPAAEQRDQWIALKNSLKHSGYTRIDVYDGRQNRIGEIFDQAKGNYVQYFYDAFGRNIEIRDARLSSRNLYNLRRIYDMNGAIVQEDSCDSGKVFQVENIYGNPAYSINGRNIRRSTSYDALLRPVKVLIEGIGTVEKIIYGETAVDSKAKNLRNQVYKYYDQAGLETRHAYSIFKKVKEQSRQLAADYRQDLDWEQDIMLESESMTEITRYNGLDQKVEYTAPDGRGYQYTYNRQSMLKQIQTKQNGAYIPLVSLITYNARRKQTNIEYANGSRCHYEYDPASGQLRIQQTYNAAGKVLQELYYTYDPAGNIAAVRDGRSAIMARHNQIIPPGREYQYDHCYRLEQASGRELTAAANDDQDITAYTRHYSYDLGGNMVGVSHRGIGQRYHKEMQIAEDGNQLLGDGAHKIIYDPCGNPQNLKGAARVSWDYSNRMSYAAAIIRAEGNDEEFYRYDHNGTRTLKISRRKISDRVWETTEKVYIGDFCRTRVRSTDRDQQRTELRINYEDMPLIADYLDRDDNKASGRKIHYLAGDHQGSITIEMDQQAELIRYDEYYPFGMVAIALVKKRSTEIKIYRYCNREKDSITGLYYWGARYYSVDYCRMLSPDQTCYINTQDWQTLNLYLFCRNNPIGYHDPDGHEWKKIAIITVSVLLVLALLTYGAKKGYDHLSYVQMGPYKEMKKDKSTPGQAHHVGQDAAFRTKIPSAKALTVKLEGNILTQKGTPHHNAHTALEKRWEPYRRGGAQYGQRPTVQEYNRYADESLEAAGFNFLQRNKVMKRLEAEQLDHGVLPNDRVPRVPRKIPLKK